MPCGFVSQLMEGSGPELAQGFCGDAVSAGTDPQSETQKFPSPQHSDVKQTLFGPQSAFVVHGTSMHSGITHAVPPPTISMQTHSPPEHSSEHGSTTLHGPDTTCAEAGLAVLRMMGAT